MPLESLPGKLRERARGSLPTGDGLGGFLKSDPVVVSFYRGDWRQFSDLNLTVHAEPLPGLLIWASRPIRRERQKRRDVSMA
jgi:hypothetical protein